jgi:NAD-dependent DNA ligase
MRSFDSLDAIRMASEEELSAIPEITDACAKQIYAYFHAAAPETEGEAPAGAGADSSPEMQVGAGGEA